MPKISFHNVFKKKRIGNEQHSEIIDVLKGISFTIPDSQIFTIIGPSGSGKSTILRLINRLEDPDDGAISYNDKLIKDMNILELRRKVGMVFQEPIMLDGTIKDNLLYTSRLQKRGDSEVIELMNRNLRLVELDEDFLKRDAEQLSGGEKQRLSIARALMNEPEVLLLDEPTSALDPSLAHKFFDTIKKIKKETGLTIICVIHQMEYAKIVGDRTMLLIKGEVIEENKTESFFNNPQLALTRKFFEGKM